jgi:hypothetical protein
MGGECEIVNLIENLYCEIWGIRVLVFGLLRKLIKAFFRFNFWWCVVVEKKLFCPQPTLLLGLAPKK